MSEYLQPKRDTKSVTLTDKLSGPMELHADDIEWIKTLPIGFGGSACQVKLRNGNMHYFDGLKSHDIAKILGVVLTEYKGATNGT